MTFGLVDGEQKPPLGYIYEAMGRANKEIQESFDDELKELKFSAILIEKIHWKSTS